MKKTTAIIIILSILVVALTGIVLYQASKSDVGIIVTDWNGKQNNNNENNINNNEQQKQETQKEPDSAIVKEEVVTVPENDSMPVTEEYDVIVFSAEPEGVVAAISAARNNLKVLLVEERTGPGGLMVYGMLNTIDMNTNDDMVILSQGIFEEFFEGIGNRTSFDVNKAKETFQDMLNREKNIKQMYNVKSIEIGATETEVTYAIIDGKKYTAKNYIDCTQDADITAMAGAEYTIGWEDINEKNKSMSATLVIKMDGVDWEAMRKHIADSAIPGTGSTEYGAWAFGEITKTYVPTQTHMRLKALNIGRQSDGSVLINSLQILNTNTLDKEAKKLAYEKCKEEAKYLAEFLRENVPGFENATLAGVADELYVRETRHIVGEYKLTVQDILESNYSVRAIAMAGYPIDIQTTSIYDWGYVIGSPDQYFIQLGCIIPKGYKNLLTVSRSSSYTSIASGSARVIPTGMTLAESAGVTCAMSTERNIDFQTILSNYSYCADLQNRIKLQGVYIDDTSKPVVDVNGQYYKYIIEMCEKGVLALGYSNEFNPNEIVSETDFIIMLKTYLKRSFIRDDLWNTDHINLLDVPEKGITPNRAKEIIYDVTTYNLTNEEDRQLIENFLNIVIAGSNNELSLVRVYEILIEFKEFLVKNEL